MSEPTPDPVTKTSMPDADLRVENRSDRVWVFGYLRMVPFVMFVGGIIGLVLVMSMMRPNPAVGIATILLVLVVPVVLDRTPLLDPVDFLVMGNQLRVKRLAGDRTWALERVRGVELSQPAGDDYDEAARTRRLVRVKVSLRKAWPAPHLVVSDTAARKIAAWAEAHGIPVTVRPN